VVRAVTNPAAGVARLRYYPRPGDRPVLALHLRGRPWASTGIQPFDWDLVPTAGEAHGRQYPILWIVATRGVEIRRRRLSTPATPDVLVLSAVNPLVEVIRVQDDALLPVPGTNVEPGRLVRSPYRWVMGEDPARTAEIPPFFRGRLALSQSAIVEHLPDGLRARHVNDEWALRIRVPRDRPAAVAYELVATRNPFGYAARIARTPNVTVHLRLSRDHERGLSQVLVDEAVVSAIDQVPLQGSHLDPEAFTFDPIRADEVTLSPRTRRVVLLAETAIGFVPYLGALYDVGQLVYAATTGRTFWGERVAEDELAVLGVVALVPVGAGGVRTLRRLARDRRLVRTILDPATVRAVREHADPALIEAVEAVEQRERAALLAGVEGYFRGVVPAGHVLSLFDDAVGERFLRALDRERLSRAFADDLEGFRDAVLAEGYRSYRSRGGTASPVRWAKLTRGRYRNRLVSILGDDFVRTIDRALADGTVPPVISQSAVSVFDHLAGRVEPYRDLVRARRQLGRWGDLFEVDHLLEKRFFDSPRVESSSDRDDILALVVPKNPAVATQLSGYEGYVHTTKTSLLRRLIPHGAEDLFTLQQWWDAHVYAYRALGADPVVYRNALRYVFEELVETGVERINFRTTQTWDDFLPENGWPVP
jgi:hypothetical protein